MRIDKASNIPLYVQVARLIEEEILNGRISEGDKLPSERKLCLSLGISRLMCRKALTTLVDRGILAVEANVGYSVRDVRAVLEQQVQDRKGLVGLIVPNFRNRYYTSFFQGVYDALHDSGMNIILGDSVEDLERERREILSFVRKGVDALILFPYTDMVDAGYVESLYAYRVPFVLSHCRPEVRADVVNVDNFGGATEAVTYLIDRGHRRIAFVTFDDPKSCYYVAQRLSAYRAALDKAGIDPVPELIICATRGESSQALEDALGTSATAVFACTDAEAFELCKQCSIQAVSVPSDLSIIGFNNYDFIWQELHYQFTTMAINYFEIGARLSRRLLTKLEGREATDSPQRDFVPVSLIDRATVRQIP